MASRVRDTTSARVADAGFRFVLVAVAAGRDSMLVGVALVVPYSLYRQIGDAHVQLDALPDRPAKSTVAGERRRYRSPRNDRRPLRVAHGLSHQFESSRCRVRILSPGRQSAVRVLGRWPADDPQRVAQELERTSGVRLDHLAILDWGCRLAAWTRLPTVSR